MSTVVVNTIGPGYWAYTAEVMVEAIDQLLEGGLPEIPPGVLNSAKNFFDQVLTVMSDTAGASFSAYANFKIAAEAFNVSHVPATGSQEVLNTSMQAFLDFVDGFPRSTPLVAEEKLTAVELRNFFRRIIRAAATERHRQFYS